MPTTTIVIAVATLLLATTAPSSAWSIWSKPTFHAHVINELGRNEMLFVHCHCTDHDQDVHHINVGTEYGWTFKKHYFFKSNLWQCYVSPEDDIDRHSDFIAFNDETESFDYNIYWVAKEDGIYFREPTQGSYKDTLQYQWIPGRLP
ncbi:hypothetical protein LINGRAHAP2_LOCUS12968 [Linum grandiflorum]